MRLPYKPFVSGFPTFLIRDSHWLVAWNNGFISMHCKRYKTSLKSLISYEEPVNFHRGQIFICKHWLSFHLVSQNSRGFRAPSYLSLPHIRDIPNPFDPAAFDSQKPGEEMSRWTWYKKHLLVHALWVSLNTFSGGTFLDVKTRKFSLLKNFGVI